MFKKKNLKNLQRTLLAVLALSLTSSGAVLAHSEVESIIAVTTVQDELNQDGDCSLREALRAANLDARVDACPAGSGSDTLMLPVGLYPLSLAGANENEGQSGDLDILHAIKLTGAGIDKTILDGAGFDRVIHIIGSAKVVIENLTIQNGFASGSLYGGGGIFNDNGDLTLSRVWLKGNTTTRIGGGLDNTGSTLAVNSMFSGNQAEKGGGIFNAGMLTLKSVTVFNNSATVTGGGLDNSSLSTLTNVTLSGNQAGTDGGGIFNDEELALMNSTLYLNSTGIANATNVRFKNTLIAGSTGGVNCTGEGTFVSEGENLEDRNDCNFYQAADLVNADPMLGPLDLNEAEILTHALMANSPAVDRGDNLDCPDTDQRGARRPADGDGDGSADCDIGAFEFGGSLPTPVFLPFLLR